MDNRDELDRLIGPAIADAGAAFPVLSGRCPDDATLALYMDRLLDGEEAGAVLEHLGRCRDCLELVLNASAPAPEVLDTAPSALVDKGMELVHAKKARILEIIASIADDAVELISCTGALLVVPSPSSARGGPAATGGILRVSKVFDGLEAVVEVERLESGAAEVSLSAVRPESGRSGILRASLIDGARELCSIVMDEGRATFEQITPGRYTIRISEAGASLCEIDLDVRG